MILIEYIHLNFDSFLTTLMMKLQMKNMRANGKNMVTEVVSELRKSLKVLLPQLR